MFDNFEGAIEDYKNGKMVILVDDENRENEGDFVMAAEKVTAEKINFMTIHGRGLICAPLSSKIIKELNLLPMVEDNRDPNNTAFTESVDAVGGGVTTGISAADRSFTISALVDENSKADSLRRPGHIFPLEAKDGGVLVRAGHTEGAIDLARLAGLKEGGVICEIMNEDGTMARLLELRVLAKKHEMKIISIEQIIAYLQKNKKLVEKTAEAKLPTEYGDFKVVVYKGEYDNLEHVALIKGDVAGKENVLVRVHSECLTGDIFMSKRCDCGNQLHKALELIEKEGSGVMLYMRQEGRGIGLINKIHAYKLQDSGLDTVEANEELGFKADLRDYGIGAQILKDIGLTSIKLLTNNPRKVVGLEGYGLKITSREEIITGVCEHNKFYLGTKRDKLGHILPENLNDLK